MAGDNVKDAPNVSGKMTTKERIFSVAVDLFAQKGFDAVSLREIAEAAGIRKATLYYYFTTKEEIIEQIFEFFFETWRHSLAGKWSEAGEIEEQVVSMELEGFMAMGNCVFTSWLGDPRMEKIMRIVFIEQYHNEQIRQSQQAFVAGGYTFFESSFAIMAKHKLIKPLDPKILAREYMSFFVYALVDYFIMRYGAFSGSFLEEYGAYINEHTAFMTNAIKP